MPDWITQIEGLIRYHLPAGGVMTSAWPAVAAIVVGLVLCFAGARLVRTGVVLGFAGVGAALGAQAAAQYEFSVITGIILGVIAVGLLGYVLFRLWVALLAGVVAVTVAACISMGPTIPGVWQEFEETRIAGGAAGDGFALMTPQQQQEALRAGAVQYCREFAQHVWSKYPGDARRAVVVLAAAFAIGVAVGLFAHRWAIVLGTAAAGTVLILAGAVPLINRSWPELVERCQERPGEALSALGVWALIAIVVQRRGLHSASSLPAAAPQPEHA